MVVNYGVKIRIVFQVAKHACFPGVLFIDGVFPGGHINYQPLWLFCQNKMMPNA
jgi:hypothetical protein